MSSLWRPSNASKPKPAWTSKKGPDKEIWSAVTWGNYALFLEEKCAQNWRYSLPVLCILHWEWLSIVDYFLNLEGPSCEMNTGRSRFAVRWGGARWWGCQSHSNLKLVLVYLSTSKRSHTVSEVCRKTFILFLCNKEYKSEGGINGGYPLGHSWYLGDLCFVILRWN